jgi:hypothetical protein
MKFQTAEDVIDLVKAFEGRRILKPDWDHQVFLTVGLYYCLRFSFGEAAQKMRAGLYRLYEAHGIINSAQNGYHETLTMFWLINIKQFVETTKSYNLAELANQLANIYCDEKLPFRYYSRDLLSSTAARKHHIPPDLDKYHLFVNSAQLLSQTRGEVTLKQI